MIRLTRDNILIKTDEIIRLRLTTLNIFPRVKQFFQKSQQGLLYREIKRLTAGDDANSLAVKLMIQESRKTYKANIKLVRDMVFEIEDRARDTLQFISACADRDSSK